jgi:hypothetical protein
MKLDIPAQLAEIERRQQFRRENALPPLDRAYELARLRTMLKLEHEAAFKTWVASWSGGSRSGG